MLKKEKALASDKVFAKVYTLKNLAVVEAGTQVGDVGTETFEFGFKNIREN